MAETIPSVAPSPTAMTAVTLMRRCHLNNSGWTVLVCSLSAIPYPFGSLASRVCPHIEQVRLARAVIMSDVEDADPQAYDTKNKSISRKCPDCLSLGI